MSIQEQLTKANITLPPFNHAAANYSPAVQSGNLIFTAGQTTRYGGVMQVMGQATEDTVEQGYQGARLCTLNCLGILDALAGGLDNISKVVKATGFVNSAPGFTKQAMVLNGATDLLVEVFGDAGRPARSAVGVSALPGNSMVEVELVVEVKDPSITKL